MSDLSIVYVIVVESEDGYHQENQEVHRDKQKADLRAKELQSVLGEDSVVHVEEHELL